MTETTRQVKGLRPSLLLVLVSALAAGCHCDRQAAREVADVSAEPAPGASGSVGSASMPERRGAVLTITTALGASAPAGALDRVARVRLTVVAADEDVSIDIPLGGTALLALPEAQGDAQLMVALLDPAGSWAGGNVIDVTALGGSIGIVALELAAHEEARGCLSCSDPVPLTEVRGLSGTQLYWSASSEIPLGQQGEALHVATRIAIGHTGRTALFARAGADVIGEWVEEGSGRIWSVARPTGSESLVALAQRLAQREEVTAIEVYRPARSGQLWPDD